MFQRRTVFVLGAGASATYGFSTGRQLLGSARGHTPESLSGFTARSVSIIDARPLLQAITDTLLPSIDAMLEHRQELWSAGKRFISALLIRQEETFRQTIRDIPDDWLSWVFERMSMGCSDINAFSANPVSFVTFNYDRLLEHRLTKGLAARYRLTVEEASNVFRQIPVVHLHGSIGPLFQSPDRNAEAAIPFGGDTNPEVNGVGLAMACAERTIKIVYEANPESDDFRRAHRLLRDSEQVIFLGFAFARSNVERLGVDEISERAPVLCSAFGMTDAEIAEYVVKSFPHHLEHSIQVGRNNESLLEFFRNRVVVAN